MPFLLNDLLWITLLTTVAAALDVNKTFDNCAHRYDTLACLLFYKGSYIISTINVLLLYAATLIYLPGSLYCLVHSLTAFYCLYCFYQWSLSKSEIK